MDRLWTALVLVAVLGLRGAAARDKTNMPKAKQEEGQSNNATALGTIVPDPSKGGRVDPEVLAGMYNRSLDVPIGGNVPSFELDGATIASLTKSANTSAANGTKWTLVTANGTKSKGEKLNASNATTHFDEATRAQKGTLSNTTGNATVQLDGATHAQVGAVPNATNAVASKSLISSELGRRYEVVHGPEPITSSEAAWDLGNTTRGWIEPMPNATNDTTGANLQASNSAGYPTNTGSFANTSAAAPVMQLDGPARGQTGPLNASASNSTGDVHNLARSEAQNGTLVAGAKTEDGPLKADPQVPTGSIADPVEKDYLAAHNQSLSNQSYTGPLGAAGSLVHPVQNGVVFVDVEAVAQRYRLAPGEEPQASANRSNDPDVVAMKEIASVVLDGAKEAAAIMTELVIRSVLPDAEHVTTMSDTELPGVIQGKFQDEGLMREVLEGDANQAHAIPEQGPCDACPQPVSVICSLCWPVDFCRPFASKVDIPCPLEQF